MPSLQAARATMRRHREERRRLLTRGERAFVSIWMFAAWALPLAGVLLLVYGAGSVRTAGVVLVALALLTMAVPVSPVLRARLRRREESERAEG